MSPPSRPSGWRSITLSECCEIVSGSTPRRDRSDFWGGGIAWATPRDVSAVQGSVLTSTAETITEQGYESCSTSLVPAGTVLYTSRAPIGLVAIAGIPVCTNQGFKSLIPGPDLDSGFLYWCMKWHTPRLSAQGSGSTFAEVSKSVMARFEIPLPPLPEQRRIALILDKADAIRRKRQESLALLDELLRLAYDALVGPGASACPTWPACRIVQLAQDQSGSMRTGPFGSGLRHSEFVDSGVAVLGIDNVVHNRFEWGERRCIRPEKYQQLKRYTVFPGDVLVTIMGTVGRSAVVPDGIPVAISTKHLASITVDRKRVEPSFLSHAIHSDRRVLAQILAANRGAIMPGLNLGIIKDLNISLPPIAAQRAFAEVVRQVEQLRGLGHAALEAAATLFRSLSQRAFQGRL